MKIILTGATGMVGEGVLLVCLEHPDVEEVLVVARKKSPVQHPRMKELILPDFSQAQEATDQLSGYDACFFCAGVSSIGHNEASFTKATYDFVIPFAEILSRITPSMIFIYVSGKGTDSTEKGKTMWARVKGRTENALTRLPFQNVYHFRPGFMKRVEGQKNVGLIYHVFGILHPLWLLILPNWASTLRQVALAMIHCVKEGYPASVLEVPDIKRAAAAGNAGGH